MELSRSGLLPAVAVVLLLGTIAVVVYLRYGGRIGAAGRLLTLLRASDAVTRVQALERTRLLPARSRAALARTLRAELEAAAKAGKHDPTTAMTIWFIRQVLGLLGDERREVRVGAARVLAALMGGTLSQLAADPLQFSDLPASIAAALEITGIRVLARTDATHAETRVLALAEMLQAGLRPLAAGVRGVQASSEEALGALTGALRDRSPRIRQTLLDVVTAMGGEKAIALLVPLLQDPSADLRAQAAQGLGRLAAHDDAPQLAQLLHDPAAAVRAAAATALAEVEAKTFCSALLEALVDESYREEGAEEARKAMLEAIVRLADGGLPALARAFSALPRPQARRLALALDSAGVVERWLGKMNWEGQEDLLAALLGALAELGVSRSLLAALDATDEGVRLQAAAALGRSHELDSVSAVAALLSDPDARVRRQAVQSLAGHARPVALEPLSTASSDPDPAVRIEAVRGLGQVLSHRDEWRPEMLPADFDLPLALTRIPRVLLAAVADTEGKVRALAAEALAAFDSQEAATTLADLALGDPSESVRTAARSAFAACGYGHKRRLLAGALEDEQDDRRAAATSLLAALGGVENGREMLRSLGDRAETVRRVALEALPSTDFTGMVEGLLLHLRHLDPRVRAAVAGCLGRAKAASAVEALVAALADPDEEVRVHALGALGSLGRPVRRHQSALAARRSDPSARVREATGRALTQLRAAWSELPETGELSREGALSPAAVAALVEAAATGDAEPLLRVLGQHNQTDELIASYLSHGGNSRLPQVLAALRKAPEQEVTRTASALAAAWIGGVAADPLLAQLRGLDPDTRLMAVEIAGRIGSGQVVSALIEVLQRDPLGEVRARAAAMLADSAHAEAEAALRRAHQDDPNNVVRRIAGRALAQETEPTPELSVLEEPGTPTADALGGGQ